MHFGNSNSEKDDDGEKDEGDHASILYFSAGIAGSGSVEDHGLFGQLRPQHDDNDDE